MKWHIGIQAQIVTLIFGLAAIYYVENQDNMSLPAPMQQILTILVFVVAFVGGFLAPYNVGRTAKYGAGTFTILAGIPLVLILYTAGEIDAGDNWGNAIIFILLLVAAIALGISIVVVAVILFVGGFIGSIFGKMVFKEHQYEIPHGYG